MYTEENHREIKSQLKKRRILLGSIAVVLLAGVIVSFVYRIKILTMILTILAGAYIIFAHEMLLSPLIAYERLIRSFLYGRTHMISGTFKAIDNEQVYRDGVCFVPVTVNVGDIKDEMDDRLLYYDANLPMPAWQEGQKLTLKVHDKAIGDWQNAV